MTYTKLLPRPPYLVDFYGQITVRIRYDNRDMVISQACGPVELPDDLPVAPLVLLDAIGPGGKKIFPTQVYDFEGDRGRGGWATYDERLFPVPKSVTKLPEPEPEPEPEPKVESKPAEVKSVERKPKTASRPSLFQDAPDVDEDRVEDVDD